MHSFGGSATQNITTELVHMPVLEKVLPRKVCQHHFQPIPRCWARRRPLQRYKGATAAEPVLLKNCFTCYEGGCLLPKASSQHALTAMEKHQLPCVHQPPQQQHTDRSSFLPLEQPNHHRNVSQGRLEQNNPQWLQHLLGITTIINFNLILIFICQKLLGLRYLNLNYYGSN